MDAKGYDFTLAGKEIKEFRCSICNLLLCEATELPCTHMNCQACLWQWQLNPEAKAGVSIDNEKEFFQCPTCNASYSLDQTRRSAVTDRVITSSLDVKCIFAQDGCGWTGTITEFQEHKLQCNYSPANCPFEGCREILKGMELAKHQKMCSYRPCEKCGRKVQECLCSKEKSPVFDGDENEEENERANEMVTCTNLLCEARVKRRNLLNHIKKCGRYGVYNMMLKDDEEKFRNARRYVQIAKSSYNELNSQIKMCKRKINQLNQNLDLVKSGSNTSSNALEPSVKKPSTPEETFKLLHALVEKNDFNHILELLGHSNLDSLREGQYEKLVEQALRSKHIESLLLLLENKSNYPSNKVTGMAVAILRSIRNSSLGVIRMLTYYNNEMINGLVEGETVLRHAVGQHSDHVLVFLLNQLNIDIEILCRDGKKSDDTLASFKYFTKYIKIKRKIGKDESFFEKLGFS